MIREGDFHVISLTNPLGTVFDCGKIAENLCISIIIEEESCLPIRDNGLAEALLRINGHSNILSLTMVSFYLRRLQNLYILFA